jgi:hypothetical protein
MGRQRSSRLIFPVKMPEAKKIMKHETGLFRGWRVVLALFFSLCLWLFLSQGNAQDAPGPLSASHNESPGLQNCQKCHTPELDISEKKCLECHPEIALRISSGRGFHRDKKQDCGLCHSEHKGKESKLIDLDAWDFDHNETGYILQEAHKIIKDCFTCHKRNNSFPRKKSRSFLLKDSRCLSCHQSPHPGRQEICQSCHSQKDWQVDIWNQRDH